MQSKLSLLRLATSAVYWATVKADEIIYADGALNSNWQDWSWQSVINYDATDIFEGTSSISINSEAWSAFSVKDGPSTIVSYAGLKFDVSGANPDVSVSLSSSADSDSSASWALSEFGATITADNFTTLLLNFNNLPPGNGAVLASDTWDRITFQAGGNGAIYHLDNIILLDEIFVNPDILSAEPIGTNVIAVTTAGGADVSTIQVALNGQAVSVVGTSTMSPIGAPSSSISYLTLASSFAPGNLTITTANGTFSYTLPSSLSGTVDQSTNYPISPLIYGVNFPTSASYIQDLGVTLSRWGGNAVTAYNPFGQFTNAGNDWYFENRVADPPSADDWIGWVGGAGSQSIVTVPALDWVAKDATSYSYPASVYPNQTAFDPYNSDAGSGLFPNGSYVTPVPDQNHVYVPWNMSAASQWLSGLANKPTIITVDNEIEIASNTHQDMHPIPMGYDEELARVLNVSAMAKAVLPDVLVAAPSTCSWWYYWISQVGASDQEAHNNTDFLPWFLDQLQAQATATGVKPVDIIDLHYYYQPDTSANDAAAKALRLRMTRSLWDPTYVDESWVATSTANHQPNSSIIQLIPRIHTLIDQHYPNTKFSLSEWSSTDDTDLTGGLLTVDALGIYGRYKLDAATYWSDPDENGPVGLAYWLYRGFGTFFGSSSAQVSIPGFDPDVLGVYAGTNGGSNLTLVVVNKDPSGPVSLNLGGVPAGTYFLRHFGGEAGVAKYQTTISITSSSYIVIPAYTAVFLQQRTGGTGYV
ncbi:hypothetical protein SISSUDRAFT_990707 [Sistotremastrum suecicum HHB10207 ss-3]|uniref:Glycoside hydrolase family 44 catalytic domain-containing protein n=1 Tax=Sistotremastrum suecicum HHB10207 ss-3 TaxID=1314776 RepID=A0A166AGE2_9AGAM|nr:hypothetical protein SISSUDRAFT_990707 [Sistotremastrum suecicum HHB10207 ss-3]